MLGPRAKDFASRWPRNLSSRGTLPPKKETLYVGRLSFLTPTLEQLTVTDTSEVSVDRDTLSKPYENPIKTQ